MIGHKIKLPAFEAFEFHPIKTTAVCLLRPEAKRDRVSQYRLPSAAHLVEVDIESQAEVKRFRLPDDPYVGQPQSSYPQIFISNARRFETVILLDSSSTVFIVDWSHSRRF